MRLFHNIIPFFIGLQLSTGFCMAQPAPFNFHHLSTTDGLSDGVVRAIGQDKYGYIWIGAISGLTRYNGYSVKVYQYAPRDTTSLPSGGARSILGDASGNLWIGSARGLFKFDYAGSKFRVVKNSKAYGVSKMIEGGKDTIYLATSRGPARFTPSTGNVFFYSEGADSLNRKLLQFSVNDFSLHAGSLYIATDTGLIRLNLATQKATHITMQPVTEKRINKIAMDTNGNVWASFGINDALLLKTDLRFSEFRVFDDFYFSAQHTEGNTINAMYVDARNRLWLTTSFQGLVLYDENKQAFKRYMNDPLQEGSVVANHLVPVFQDRQGMIWVGSEGYGVDYFDPDRIFFRVIASSSFSTHALIPKWARTAAEDKQGNLWLGWGGALTRMRPDGQSLRIWQNLKGKPPQIHYNSIRSLFCDDAGDMWICTTDGVNRYHPSTDRMEFLEEKDSLPRSFYWTVMQDSRKNIWFGDRSDLHYYDAAEKKIHSVAYHPVLWPFKNKGVHCMMEDSKQRLWFGMNGYGLLMYDPGTHRLKHWLRSDANDTTLMGNVITSLAEDKKGIIWISSFIGMVSYDPERDQFRQYNRQNGLASIKTSCLMVDAKNRLWIGTTAGLMMLDSSRRHFKNFDLHDGLPTLEFNDQPAYRMKDGRFVFPSVKGFVVFDADAYKEEASAPLFYLSSFKVHNNEFRSSSNYEELKQLNLHYDENFFSIELAALNYSNPQQTWYAYKLEPFDKDWIYTQDRIANYTNVPGGNYLFRYKATTNPNNWEGAEKVLQIVIGTVYYKTVWFWLLVAAFMAGILYWLYRIRLKQQERIYLLQSKAQALEKEKMLVMYESLKQQLNPHFLFNSLTSLGSLIRSNQKVAGEFLDSLSKTYRYILKSRDNEIVPLGNELKFAETYIRLQQTRFHKGMQVCINVDEEYLYRKIAPVTLQHLIENAIKHNIVDEETPLQVDIFVEEDYLVVRNNLQRKKSVETSNKQGLMNLQSLYHYLSPRPVEVRDDEHFFTVKIPLI